MIQNFIDLGGISKGKCYFQSWKAWKHEITPQIIFFLLPLLYVCGVSFVFFILDLFFECSIFFSKRLKYSEQSHKCACWIILWMKLDFKVFIKDRRKRRHKWAPFNEFRRRKLFAYSSLALYITRLGNEGYLASFIDGG